MGFTAMKMTVPTAGDLEAGLIEIWERILKVSPITANDDFYDSGGDSFLAIEMLLEVERQFGIEPQPSMLAGGITIASLSVWIGSQVGDAVT